MRYLLSHRTRVHGREIDQPTSASFSVELPSHSDALTQSALFDAPVDDDGFDDDVNVMDDYDQNRSRSNMPGVSKEVFNFYSAFGDTTIPVFSKPPSLSPQWDTIPEHIKISVTYATEASMSKRECHHYYKHIIKRDAAITASPPSSSHPSLLEYFPTPDQFYNYIINYNKSKVLDEGWVRAKIKLDIGQTSVTNTNGCFRCPLKLLEEVFLKSGGTASSIIPFQKNFDSSNTRTFSSPWDTLLYEQYCSTVNFGNVIIVDFFADGCTLARSGTQSGTFVRVRFANIKHFSEKWFDIGIAPTLKNFPDYVPDIVKRRLRALLYHRFLFTMMKNLVKASYNGLVVNGVTLVPRIGMCIADQPEERMLLCLKGHDSFMDCTLCTLPSRISAQGNVSSDDEQASRQSSVSNRSGQLSSEMHSTRPVQKTVKCQLDIANHKFHGHELSGDLLMRIRSFLIRNSAQDFPSFFASFDGLGSLPFALFIIIVLDKLHVFDIGIIRNFTDWVCLVIQKHNNQLPLTRLISILNDRYTDIPPSARLPHLRPFRLKIDDVQAGMSGKIRRLSAPFLWVCVMGVSDKNPDEDDLLQCALNLDKVNQFLCSANNISVRHLTIAKINEWQEFIFDFGRQMSMTFDKDVTTKLHRLMRHVKDQLSMHGCIRRSSTEENEHEHIKHKKAYRLTNKHLDSIGVQLLRAHVHSDEVCSSSDSESGDEDNDLPSSLSTTWNHLQSIASETINSMSGSFHPRQISSCILEKKDPVNGRHYFRALKRFSLDKRCVPIARHLKHRSLCSGDVVYGKPNRHDSVEFVQDFVPCIGTIESILAPNGCGYSNSMRILLVRLLVEVPPDDGNSLVVNKFGHTRYRYDTSDMFRVKTVCVIRSAIIKPAIVVLDPYWAKCRFGLTTRLKDIPDSDELRCEVRFFHVKGVSLTLSQQVKGPTEHQDL